MSAADVALQQPQQAHDQEQAFADAPGQQVQYVMQMPAAQGVVYAQAPQAVSWAPALPMQYTYMAPPEGQVYVNAAAEGGQQVVLQDGQQVYAEGMEVQQVVLQDGQQAVGDFAYAAPEAQQAMVQEGQQVVHQDMQFASAVPEGAEMVQAGAEGQQVATPLVPAAPARVNVSPEIFAKLVAGGQLTPDEMAQLSGQPTPGQEPLASPTPETAGAAAQAANAQPGTPPGSTEAAVTSDEKDTKDKSDSKEPLKASKKKNKSCC